jgi:hypothetical protein
MKSSQTFCCRPVLFVGQSCLPGDYFSALLMGKPVCVTNPLLVAAVGLAERDNSVLAAVIGYFERTWLRCRDGNG